MVGVVSPQTGNVVQAEGESVQRFIDAGWTLAKGEKSPVVEKPAEGDGGDESPAPDPAPVAPVGEPRGNASTETWAEYARGLGVEFPEDATRKEIQEAIDAQ